MQHDTYTCANCAYFNPSDDSGTHLCGECRRFPPGGNADDGRTMWPRVCDHLGCGEYHGTDTEDTAPVVGGAMCMDCKFGKNLNGDEYICENSDMEHAYGGTHSWDSSCGAGVLRRVRRPTPRPGPLDDVEAADEVQRELEEAQFLFEEQLYQRQREDRAVKDALRDALTLARDCTDPAHREKAGRIAELLQKLQVSS